MTEKDIQHHEQMTREGLYINNAQSDSVYGQSQRPYQTADTYKVHQQGNTGHSVFDYSLQQLSLDIDTSPLGSDSNKSMTRSSIPSQVKPSGCKSVFSLSLQQAYNVPERNDQRCDSAPQDNHIRYALCTGPQEASKGCNSQIPQQTVDYIRQTIPGNTNQIGRYHVSGSTREMGINLQDSTWNPGTSTGNPYKQHSSSAHSAASSGTGIPENNTHCGKGLKVDSESALYHLPSGTVQYTHMRGMNSLPNTARESRTHPKPKTLNSFPKEQMKFTGAGRAKLAEEARRSNFARICTGQGWLLNTKINNNNNNSNNNNNNNNSNNKRLSQQPALGALTFLRSFVAGKANFCSHLLASLVHFTVVKSQAIYHLSWGRRSYSSFLLGSQKLFIIRHGVAEVISAVT